jgi:VanZ family protein
LRLTVALTGRRSIGEVSQILKSSGLITKLARFSAWALAAAITVLTLVPLSLRPVTGLPREVEHAAIFGAAGMAFAVGYRGRLVALVMLAVIYSGALELAQMMAPGRHARLEDFMTNALSACLMILFCDVVLRDPSPPISPPGDGR